MKKETGVVRIIKAAEYSLAGFKAAWNSEAAFRQEVIGALILVPVGILLGKTGVEKALLSSSPLAIVVVELLNSGLEAVVDRTGNDFHPLAKNAKDMGSAAVFLSIVMTVTVWFLIII
ncbi:MAG: diacylglycerol kinase [Desulfotignum sp.]